MRRYSEQNECGALLQGAIESHRVRDTSALQRVIVNEVPQEDVRVDADQRFLA